MFRRRFWMTTVSLAVLVAGGLALAACGGDDSDDVAAKASPSASAVASAPPAELKDLTVGVPADTTNLDGDKATLAQVSPNAGVLEPLLLMTPGYEVKPHLAEKYEFVPPNTWRFTLRKGIKFHDGSELTARDVAWTFDRVARAGGRSINAAVGGTRVIDDYTFEYTPSKLNLKVPLQVVHPIFGIHKAGSDPTKNPIGTGPFKFASYSPKESLKVERFEGYWNQAGVAKVRTVTFRYILDNNARVLALQAGDVDIITQVPRESSTQLTDKYQVVTSSVGAYEALSINVNGQGEWATTADKAIREAVARGIDRATIVKTVWEGNAEVGKNLIPPSILGSAKGKVAGGLNYDPEGARKVLDAAGWKPGSDGIREKGGKRLQLTLINGYPEPETHRPIPEVIQSQLKKIGIEVKIVETQSYDKTLKDGVGHLWLERGNQNDANPAFLPGLLYMSSEAGNTSDYGARFGIGKKVDEPLLAAAGTADIPLTQDLSAQAMKVLIDEEYVVIPIAGLYNITAASKNISGWRPHSALVHTSFASVVKK